MNQSALQSIVLDGHVHLYPCYQLDKALNALFGNLARLGTNATKVAFLAERFDCDFFDNLKNNRCEDLPGYIHVLAGDDEKVITLVHEKRQEELLLVAGRQIVTQERIEVLAIAWHKPVPNGLSAHKVVDQIRTDGGVPIVSWSPGKWMFGRREVILQLLKDFPPGSLALGDTTLRPIGWGRPKLMQQGVSAGFSLTAGSDPLPFAGEEKYLGSYGTLLTADFDKTSPVESIRKLLLSKPATGQLVGKRNQPIEMIGRQIKNIAAKKMAS